MFEEGEGMIIRDDSILVHGGRVREVIIRDKRRAGGFPELHFAGLITTIRPYGQEDDIIPGPNQVVQGPFQGFLALL